LYLYALRRQQGPKQ